MRWLLYFHIPLITYLRVHLCVSVVSSVGGRVQRFGAGLCVCVSGLVWRFLGCGVCAFGKFKSHRASVDYLWRHLTTVCVCVCLYTCTCARHSVGHQSFPTIPSAVNSSVGLFSSNKIPRRCASCSWEGACDQSVIWFCPLFSDVAAGLDRNAAGSESLPLVPLGILSTEE